MNLAEVYMAKGLYDKAKEILKLYLDEISDNAFPRFCLSRVYLLQRDYANARTEINRSIDLNPDFPFAYFTRGMFSQCQNDWTNAYEDYDHLLNSKLPSARLMGNMGLVNLYINRGNFLKAKLQANQGIELAKKYKQSDWETWFRFSFAYAHLRTGNLKKALEEIEKALTIAREMENLSTQRSVHLLKGFVYVHSHQLDEAQKTADRLDALTQIGSNKNVVRQSYLLKGAIESKKGNFSSAVKLISDAIALLPFEREFSDNHAIFLETLADAYYKSGDLDKASETYEKIIVLTLSRIQTGDIYAKSFYRLGEISEEQGNTAKALENYEKFLDLWKDADPGIAEVEDAKKRLTNLKN